MTTDGHLTATITDDGQGDPDDITGTGDGLANIRNRATSRGGTFHIAPSHTGTGLTLTWKIPLA